MSDLWTEVTHRRNDYREIPSIIAGNKNETLSKKVVLQTELFLSAF